VLGRASTAYSRFDHSTSNTTALPLVQNIMNTCKRGVLYVNPQQMNKKIVLKTGSKLTMLQCIFVMPLFFEESLFLTQNYVFKN